MPEEKLCRKYIIRKTDGTPMSHESRYFVLRYDKNSKYGALNRFILGRWCREAKVYHELEQLTDDLLKDLNNEAENVDE